MGEMLTLEFAPIDLARVRFSVSPLTELWQSVRALQSPVARTMHLPWVTAAGACLDAGEIAILQALQPPSGINPDFIHPPPRGPAPALESELEEMATTPPDRVRRELSEAYCGRRVPAVLDPFIQRPDEALAELSQLLRTYWDRALAPHWGRIKAALDGDILQRSYQSACYGAQVVLGGLDDRVTYDDERLLFDNNWTGSQSLGGQGLLLIPSVFIWPLIALVHEAPWQPTVIYPALGSGLLWEPATLSSTALGELIGSRRASVLASLDVPSSTTELARRFGASPGSVSQHLSVLQRAGLVHRRRVGRTVLYRRSQIGDSLVRGVASG
jgi:DNA-binding transcriptional ArsR family regulator